MIVESLIWCDIFEGEQHNHNQDHNHNNKDNNNNNNNNNNNTNTNNKVMRFFPRIQIHWIGK